jgi:hypothetical protein
MRVDDMRNDALGMFWQDLPPQKKVSVEKEKRTPPERTWEHPDYLPNLDAALEMAGVELFTDNELIEAARAGERLVWDCESYPNYFSVGFQSCQSGKCVGFQMDENTRIDLNKLRWVLESFCLVDFNGRNYDEPIIKVILSGGSTADAYSATEMIIMQEMRPYEVLRKFGIKNEIISLNHIDLIEVCPSAASLKSYAGRLHSLVMQDLPFVPGSILTESQKKILYWYMFNDLRHTRDLYKELSKQIELRENMSLQYQTDLRSKSDAQIAETVLSNQISAISGVRCKRPNIEIGTIYKYHIPEYMKFRTPIMQRVLETIRNVEFVVNETGSVGMPPVLNGLEINIANAVYRMGIGGLHSSEKSSVYNNKQGYRILDRDVESYYPSIILNQGLYPKHLGTNFLDAYRRIVETRVRAKREKNTVVADSLKVTINGSFGKLNNKYSILYAPDLFIQVVITGQLSQLLLIEALEIAGISVASANTDGIVMILRPEQEQTYNSIFSDWEKATGFRTEETEYSALYSRDVNNYMAFKTDGSVKVKGVYSERGSNGNSILSKNPCGMISVDAVVAYLRDGTNISETIRACKDIRRFVYVRQVKGGAVKDGEYLGKTIRWYYSTEKTGKIIYALNGNKVPRTEGATPLMTLPSCVPEDIDHEWYIFESYKILEEIGIVV